MAFNKAQLNAVIGFPLAHSKSPVLHNALYEKLGVNAVMKPFSNKSISKLVKTIKQLSIVLTAVTMPFKEEIIPFLDKVDVKAKAMSAVNTVINIKGELYGYNTDIDGIASALKKVSIKNKNVLLLGAGGAARALAYYIQSKRGNILYLNRTKSKAFKLKKQFGGQLISPKQAYSLKIHLIVNATPIGMYPKISETALPGYSFKKTQTVFDLVYNPLETELLKQAKAQGAKTISGIEMFIGQAIRQIELFLGKKLGNDELRHFAKSTLIKTL